MHDLGHSRQQLRDARRALSPEARRTAAMQALGRIRNLAQFRNADRIALYLGIDGELCPSPLADIAWQLGKVVCLPVLHPIQQGQLLFSRWRRDQPLRRNRYGIAEPLPSDRNIVRALHLDLVVVPLLGFDRCCNRIGMGGGYYDRTFAFRRHRHALKTPFLVGLAHEVQHVDTIRHQPWDVQLDAVASNDALYRATHQHPG